MDRPDLPLLRRFLTGFFLILTGPSSSSSVPHPNGWRQALLVHILSIKVTSTVGGRGLLAPHDEPCRYLFLCCNGCLPKCMLCTCSAGQDARNNQQPAFPRWARNCVGRQGFFLSLPCVPHVFFVSLLMFSPFFLDFSTFPACCHWVATAFPCLRSLFSFSACFHFLLFFFIVFPCLPLFPVFLTRFLPKFVLVTRCCPLICFSSYCVIHVSTVSRFPNGSPPCFLMSVFSPSSSPCSLCFFSFVPLCFFFPFLLFCFVFSIARSSFGFCI